MQSYAQYLKQRFGEPVMKIPLNGGFTCPNRDGSKGRGGCAFCSNAAFSPVSGTKAPVAEQLQNGMSRAGRRFGKFIAYFQPYSNTYAPLHTLKRIYEPVLAVPGVVGIAIGTRPDCLTPEIYDFLGELNQKKYLSVELGMQTIHNKTLQHLGAGRTHADFLSAVRALAERQIEVVAHTLLGLPGESETMMMETARALASIPVQGVKLHQLMIIKGTPLAEEYGAGGVKVLSLETYSRLAAGFVVRLREDQCLHRLMADCRPGAGLLAPEWSADKAAALKVIRQKIVAFSARYPVKN